MLLAQMPLHCPYKVPTGTSGHCLSSGCVTNTGGWGKGPLWQAVSLVRPVCHLLTAPSCIALSVPHRAVPSGPYVHPMTSWRRHSECHHCKDQVSCNPVGQAAHAHPTGDVHPCRPGVLSEAHVPETRPLTLCPPHCFDRQMCLAQDCRMIRFPVHLFAPGSCSHMHTPAAQPSPLLDTVAGQGEFDEH